MNNKKAEKKILVFLGFLDQNYSRSAVLLNYPSSKYEKKFYKAPKNFISTIRVVANLRKIYKDRHLTFIVMSPCHKLTLPTRIVAKKRVILDAGWPLSDGELSRKFRWKSIYSIPKIIIMDFIAFHSANLVLLESEKQKQRVARMFKISSEKLEVSFTGFNESSILRKKVDNGFSIKIRNQIQSLGNLGVVIFRGKVNNESGYERIIQVAKELDNRATFLLLVNRNQWSGLVPKNCIEINSFTDEQMFLCYEIANLALGQISNHKRLDFTIPHKAFEAGFFGKTYVTCKNGGIQEYGNENQISYLDSIDPKKIALHILDLFSSMKIEAFGKNLNTNYLVKFSQSALNRNFEYSMTRHFPE